MKFSVLSKYHHFEFTSNENSNFRRCNEIAFPVTVICMPQVNFKLHVKDKQKVLSLTLSLEKKKCGNNKLMSSRRIIRREKVRNQRRN